MRSYKNARQQWPGVFLCLWFLSCAPFVGANCPAQAPLQWAELRRVVDGDTLHLEDGRKLRLIAVNTPELGRDGVASQPLAEQARAEVKRFFAGDRRIGLQSGQDPRDHYGRQLVHVYRADGQSLAAHLLAQGLAWRIAVPPNLAYQHCLGQHERQARDAGLGVWSLAAYQPKPAATLTPADSGFSMVRGRVNSIVASNKGWWVELERISIWLPKHRQHFFGADEPGSWLWQDVIIRGWIIDRSDSAAVKRHGYAPFKMNLHHPSMISLPGRQKSE